MKAIASDKCFYPCSAYQEMVLDDGWTRCLYAVTVGRDSKHFPGPSCPLPDVPEPDAHGCLNLDAMGKFIAKLRRLP
jgi:hypothetical protein